MSLLKICRTLRDVKTLIQHIKTTGYCSFDFETSSLKYYDKNEYATIMGVSFQPGSSWVVPLGHFESPFKKDFIKILLLFKEEVFENYEIVKVAWNLKYEYKWLKKYGIDMRGRLFDGMLAKYCLDEMRPMGLKEFVAEHYPKYAGYELSVKGRQWVNIPLDELSKYCGIDSDITLRAMLWMEPKLIKLGFYSVFRNLLMMGVRALGDAEYNGMLIDRDFLDKKAVEYAAKIADIERQLYALPKVVKFERKNRIQHTSKLIDEIRLDIEKVKKANKGNVSLLVANREKKIARIVEGTFTKKEMYEPFNFRSPKQLGELLFSSKYGFHYKVVRYTVNKKTKKESNNPSTDESVILELQEKHPNNSFLNLLLLHREYSKLHSTYMVGMQEILTAKDRVHANFHLSGTVTGRLSCTEPNLQNIPRNTTSSDIKPMFIAPRGYLLAEVDYSQAELRIGAELAKDEVMIDIFKRNYNIHVATACKANHCLDRYDEIKAIIKKGDEMTGDELAMPENKEFLKWIKEKKKGKTVNFGIFYGQGDEKLAEGMGTTKQEAHDFRMKWQETYPGVMKWIGRQEKFARKHGYVKTIFGRKRRLPDAMFRDKWEAKAHGMMGKFLEAMRQSVNAPIQGSAADFTLFSLIVIWEQQKLGLFPKDMQLVYTVHDSIGYYIKPKHIHWAIADMFKICDNPQTKRYFGFQMEHVRMKISAEAGINWGDLSSYSPSTDYCKLIH